MSSGSESRLLRCANRIYEVMLHAYPPTFQHAYGREMMLVFTNQAHDTLHRRGRVGFLGFGRRILWEWLTTVLTEMERETMRKALTAGIATFLLLVVDWFTFHDFREPHTVRDYLTLFASLLVFVYFGTELLNREKVRLRA
jgi:hypothetical protein